ncbi:MAG: hypothetical protein J5J00_12360 [Deltaproteobacteria bacterium]|nr:hypothetical protein [Deltaproteobacteria bacterium]
MQIRLSVIKQKISAIRRLAEPSGVGLVENGAMYFERMEKNRMDGRIYWQQLVKSGR